MTELELQTIIIVACLFVGAWLIMEIAKRLQTSVPQETVDLLGNIAEQALNLAREYAKKSPNKIDDAIVSLIDDEPSEEPAEKVE